jgi:hypothetical protein
MRYDEWRDARDAAEMPNPTPVPALTPEQRANVLRSLAELERDGHTDHASTLRATFFAHDALAAENRALRKALERIMARTADLKWRDLKARADASFMAYSIADDALAVIRPLANDDRAAMAIHPGPAGVTLRPFTPEEVKALDATRPPEAPRGEVK